MSSNPDANSAPRLDFKLSKRSASQVLSTPLLPIVLGIAVPTLILAVILLFCLLGRPHNSGPNRVFTGSNRASRSIHLNAWHGGEGTRSAGSQTHIDHPYRRTHRHRRRGGDPNWGHRRSSLARGYIANSDGSLQTASARSPNYRHYQSQTPTIEHHHPSPRAMRPAHMREEILNDAVPNIELLTIRSFRSSTQGGRWEDLSADGRPNI